MVLGYVDKAQAQPYLCPTMSVAIALILTAFLVIEPWIAEFPLLWRMIPFGAGRNASR
jgi:hypothetical protein